MKIVNLRTRDAGVTLRYRCDGLSLALGDAVMIDTENCEEIAFVAQEPYVEYSKEEYKEVYVKMFKRMVAQYLQAKPTLNITNAVSTLSTAKELAVAWQNDVKEELPEGTFKGMISELKTFITKDI